MLYEVTTKHGERVDAYYQWVATDIQFPMKLAKKDGSWIIEGYGVEPDIEVTNDPQSVIDGRDLQLERGIVEVLAAMDRMPQPRPAAQPP